MRSAGSGVLWSGNLKNLTVSGNYFTSLGSCCWDLIKEGRLNVDGNCIPYAPNQRSHEYCEKFSRQPKSCPVNNYLPCKPTEYHGSGEQVDASAVEEYKYRTHSIGAASMMGRAHIVAQVEKRTSVVLPDHRETTDQ